MILTEKAKRNFIKILQNRKTTNKHFKPVQKRSGFVLQQNILQKIKKNLYKNLDINYIQNIFTSLIKEKKLKERWKIIKKQYVGGVAELHLR